MSEEDIRNETFLQSIHSSACENMFLLGNPHLICLCPFAPIRLDRTFPSSITLRKLIGPVPQPTQKRQQFVQRRDWVQVYQKMSQKGHMLVRTCITPITPTLTKLRRESRKPQVSNFLPLVRRSMAHFLTRLLHA